LGGLEPTANALKGRLSIVIISLYTGTYDGFVFSCSLCCSFDSSLFALFPAVSGEKTFSPSSQPAATSGVVPTYFLEEPTATIQRSLQRNSRISDMGDRDAPQRWQAFTRTIEASSAGLNTNFHSGALERSNDRYEHSLWWRHKRPDVTIRIGDERFGAPTILSWLLDNPITRLPLLYRR